MFCNPASGQQKEKWNLRESTRKNENQTLQFCTFGLDVLFAFVLKPCLPSFSRVLFFFTCTCYWNTSGVLKVTVFELSKLCESTFVPHFSWVWDRGGRVFYCVLDRLSVWAENKVLNCLNIFALYGLYLNWTKFMQKINLKNCKFYSDLKSIFICLPKNKNQPFLIGTIFK